MNLIIFTDGSYQDGIGVASSIFLTENMYIQNIVKEYKAISSAQIELYGVLQALRYVHENNLEPDNIVLYTDAQFILKKYNVLKRNQYISWNTESRELWIDLLKLSEIYNLTIRHYKAHQHHNSPNKICDLQSKIYLRKIIQSA